MDYKKINNILGALELEQKKNHNQNDNQNQFTRDMLLGNKKYNINLINPQRSFDCTSQKNNNEFSNKILNYNFKKN